MNLCHFCNFASEKNCSFSLVFSQPQKCENPILALLMVNINMLGEKTQWTVGHFCQCVVALRTHCNILSLLTLYDVKFTLFFWMKVKKYKRTKSWPGCSKPLQKGFKSKLSETLRWLSDDSGEHHMTHSLPNDSNDSQMTTIWTQ